MGEEKKAWDVKDLEAKLKAAGMPHVEGMAKAAATSLFDWIEESVKATDGKVDDLALALSGPLRTWVLGKIDQISHPAPEASLDKPAE